MRYLQTYEQHNEGIKSAVLGAALGASLFANSPTVTAQSLVKPALTNPTSKDGINDAVEQVEGLSNIRKTDLNPKDDQLNNILSEIVYCFLFLLYNYNNIPIPFNTWGIKKIKLMSTLQNR